ncbi:MAG: aminoglycoside phosphotransferase [Desulfobacteraceae bacterium]|nr:MAG: aminoglycoside phosphotransferase [Desulfobacteraceae bacterium]
MKALILAAGLGTRLAPYTDHTPKPLFPVGGRPLLDIIIRNLETAGCEAIVINTHHLHNKIDAFINSQKYSIPVKTLYEPVILGTGGAIKNAGEFWNNKPFIVINSDIFTDIDLREVYEFHLGHNNPATLVLTNFEKFNNVLIGEDDVILGFENSSADSLSCIDRGNIRRLAFTGIQVLDPDILRFIPAGLFSNSIDVYRQMISCGKKLNAFTPKKHNWNDLGTPEKYIETAIGETAPKAFRLAFPDYIDRKIDMFRLKGDGSDKRWFRLVSGKNSLIMADHGIRKDLSVVEADSFIAIGLHLHNKGLSVPRIFLHDSFSGVVFLEDLGDTNFQTLIMNKKSQSEINSSYKSVIDLLIKLSLTGGSDFDISWTYQTPCYTEDLIIEKECKYFMDAFIKGYLNKDVDFDVYENEFKLIASYALEYQVKGFMHRDMQSRNIMVKEENIYFIDFQGGRIGPLQYDLASLLIDPYVGLPSGVRYKLADYCAKKISSLAGINSNDFYRCYKYCSITRNLQILGAFGYLSRVKGKSFFENYIPAAVRSLKESFESQEGKAFPKLKSLIDNLL